LVAAGLLVGVWIAYGLVRLDKPRNLSAGEAMIVVPILAGLTVWLMAMHAALQDWVLTELRFAEWVCFVLAALLVRVAIVIASFTKARGRLVVSFGLLAVCAGLGYLLARSPSHLGTIETSRILAADRATWLLFGALVGLGLALARARHSDRSRIGRLEVVVVAPILAVTLLWAGYSGAQANGWYVPGPQAVLGLPTGDGHAPIRAPILLLGGENGARLATDGRAQRAN
jgi:hypothetical protein